MLTHVDQNGLKYDTIMLGSFTKQTEAKFLVVAVQPMFNEFTDRHSLHINIIDQLRTQI